MGVNLSIKDVPHEVAERLRQRAARHHRSLQGELMAIVEQAAAQPLGEARTRGPATRLTESPRRSPADIAAAARQRLPGGSPSSVELIRAMRDGRPAPGNGPDE